VNKQCHKKYENILDVFMALEIYSDMAIAIDFFKCVAVIVF